MTFAKRWNVEKGLASLLRIAHSPSNVSVIRAGNKLVLPMIIISNFSLA